MDDRRWTMPLVVLVVCVVVNVAGCSSAPAQKATQTVAPDSTTASTLKDVQAQVLSLAQQNTAIINAIQKSSQDTDQFRDQVKGSIASLTQVQFRFESWLAEVSDGWRLRMLGCAPYRPAGQAGPELVVGPDRVRDPARPDARSAGAGTGGKDDDVTTDDGPSSTAGGPSSMVHGPTEWRPTMLQLIVAFLLGCVLSSVVLGILAALHQVIADHVLAKIGVIISWLWAKLVGLIALFKPKTAAPPTSPAAK